MQDLRLSGVPATRTGMLIRRPVSEVFEAFVDPAVTTLTETGFTGDGDALVQQVTNSTQGFSLMLAGAKAFLEHGIRLNLVADRYPKGIEQH